MNNNSPTSARIILSNEKMHQALQLRKAGATYKLIADQLGVSTRMACTYVKKAIDIQNAKNGEEAQDIINLELSRLDSMLLSIRDKLKADNPNQLGAIDRALKIMDQRAKITGIYSPFKVAPTTPDGSEQFEGDTSYKEILLQKLEDLQNK